MDKGSLNVGDEVEMVTLLEDFPVRQSNRPQIGDVGKIVGLNRSVVRVAFEGKPYKGPVGWPFYYAELCKVGPTEAWDELELQ